MLRKWTLVTPGATFLFSTFSGLGHSALLLLSQQLLLVVLFEVIYDYSIPPYCFFQSFFHFTLYYSWFFLVGQFHNFSLHFRVIGIPIFCIYYISYLLIIPSFSIFSVFILPFIAPVLIVCLAVTCLISLNKFRVSKPLVFSMVLHISL